MEDYIVRATAAGGQIRAFAATTKHLVEEARQAHNSSPVVTAGLGRLMTAAVMMGTMMKGDKDILTLQVKGDGPVGGLTVTSDAKGNVKGYADNPEVIIPANAAGKLDVAGAVGSGYLNVIKDLGLKEPYNGHIELQTGEIAEDITYYFAVSEQTPSGVGLGVLMERDNTVRQAGGFIIQLMPSASEEVISQLEKNLAGMTSVTALLDDGIDPEGMLKLLTESMDLEILGRVPAAFYCNCCKDRVAKALISIGKKDLSEMIDDGKEIEVNCHFCNTGYTFTVDELKELSDLARGEAGRGAE